MQSLATVIPFSEQLARLKNDHSSVLDRSLSSVRRTGVSIVNGVLMGILHSTLPRGLDTGVPIDAVTGVWASIAGVVSTSEHAQELQTLGAQNLGIYSFRKTHELLANVAFEVRRRSPDILGDNSTFSGESDEVDPILRVARRL